MNDLQFDLTPGMVASALALADRAIVCDVECEGLQDPASRDLYEIGAMFDPNEHSPQFVDMAIQGIAYGVARGLLELLPTPPLRVRVLRRPT